MTQDEFNELRILDLKAAIEEGLAENNTEYVAYARKQLADLYMEVEDIDKAKELYEKALEDGADDVYENLGLCYYRQGDENKARELWKRGVDDGDRMCILRYGLSLVEAHEEDEEIIDKLKSIAEATDEPDGDACAVLYLHYAWEGDEDAAWAWREKAIDLESSLMQY